MKKLIVAVGLSGVLLGASAAAPPPTHGCVCAAFMVGYKSAKALGADRLGDWIGEKVYKLINS